MSYKSPADLAREIADRLAADRLEAERAGLSTLAYLLDMARMEAAHSAEHPPPPPPEYPHGEPRQTPKRSERRRFWGARRS